MDFKKDHPEEATQKSTTNNGSSAEISVSNQDNVSDQPVATHGIPVTIPWGNLNLEQLQQLAALTKLYSTQISAKAATGDSAPELETGGAVNATGSSSSLSVLSQPNETSKNSGLECKRGLDTVSNASTSEHEQAVEKNVTESQLSEKGSQILAVASPLAAPQQALKISTLVPASAPTVVAAQSVLESKEEKVSTHTPPQSNNCSPKLENVSNSDTKSAKEEGEMDESRAPSEVDVMSPTKIRKTEQQQQQPPTPQTAGMHQNKQQEAEQMEQISQEHESKAVSKTDMRSKSDTPKGIRLFVGNLNHDTREAQFREAFEKFGDVTTIFLRPGFGFVSMATMESAKRAIEEGQNTVLAGSKIVVRMADKERPRVTPHVNTSKKDNGFSGVNHHSATPANSPPPPAKRLRVESAQPSTASRPLTNAPDSLTKRPMSAVPPSRHVQDKSLSPPPRTAHPTGMSHFSNNHHHGSTHAPLQVPHSARTEHAPRINVWEKYDVRQPKWMKIEGTPPPEVQAIVIGRVTDTYVDRIETHLKDFTLDIVFSRDDVPKPVIEDLIEHNVNVVLYIEEFHEMDDLLTVHTYLRKRKEEQRTSRLKSAIDVVYDFYRRYSHMFSKYPIQIANKNESAAVTAGAATSAGSFAPHSVISDNNNPRTVFPTSASSTAAHSISGDDHHNSINKRLNGQPNHQNNHKRKSAKSSNDKVKPSHGGNNHSNNDDRKYLANNLNDDGRQSAHVQNEERKHPANNATGTFSGSRYPSEMQSRNPMLMPHNAQSDNGALRPIASHSFAIPAAENAQFDPATDALHRRIAEERERISSTRNSKANSFAQNPGMSAANGTMAIDTSRHTMHNNEARGGHNSSHNNVSASAPASALATNNKARNSSDLTLSRYNNNNNVDMESYVGGPFSANSILMGGANGLGMKLDAQQNPAAMFMAAQAAAAAAAAAAAMQQQQHGRAGQPTPSVTPTPGGQQQHASVGNGNNGTAAFANGGMGYDFASMMQFLPLLNPQAALAMMGGDANKMNMEAHNMNGDGATANSLMAQQMLMATLLGGAGAGGGPTAAPSPAPSDVNALFANLMGNNNNNVGNSNNTKP